MFHCFLNVSAMLMSYYVTEVAFYCNFLTCFRTISSPLSDRYANSGESAGCRNCGQFRSVHFKDIAPSTSRVACLVL
jgi:hypothetical protein